MREYRRILALVDLDDAQHEAVARRALNLARLGRAELVLLHLIEPDPSLDGGYPAPSRQATRQGFEAGGIRRLAFLAARLGAGEADLRVRYGEPAREFEACARECMPDLVIAARDTGFIAGRHDLLLLGAANTGRRSRGIGMAWLGTLAGLSRT